ncbi:MAG: heat-inducible transcriptional repressor HrcA [Acidimicrobiales bacterium]
MLDDRKAAILRAVVQEYIETAQPVASAHLAQTGRFGVSSATVRNEMAALEREGFLAHPHTSAGRIPTDKGYRFFVDHITSGADAPGQRQSLRPAQRQQVHEFFTRAHGQLEQMLTDTSRLLSNLTRYAAVIVAPPHEDAVVRSVQIVGLGPRLALAVAVMSDGAVDKATIELDLAVDDDLIASAAAVLNASLRGTALVGMRPLSGTGDEVVDRLAEAARAAIAESHGNECEQVFVGGAWQMVATFDAVETVRQVLAILEQQYVVVTVLREALLREVPGTDSISVAIGTEHGVRSLAECSLIVAPFDVDGAGAGTIGVLGPTRMNYREAMAAVAVVSERLGRKLSEA